MNGNGLALLTLLVAVLTVDAARAQDATPPRASLDVGVGYGGAGAGPETVPGGHLAGRVAIRLDVGRLVFVGRTTMTTGGPSDYPSGLFAFTDTLHDEFMDYGLLVGYAAPLGGTWESYAAGGLALVSGTRAASNDCSGFSSFCFSNGRRVRFDLRPGFPLEAGLSAGLSRVLRLGLVGYANVNAEETFGGGVVSLTIRSR